MEDVVPKIHHKINSLRHIYSETISNTLKRYVVILLDCEIFIEKKYERQGYLGEASRRWLARETEWANPGLIHKKIVALCDLFVTFGSRPHILHRGQVALSC